MRERDGYRSGARCFSVAGSNAQSAAKQLGPANVSRTGRFGACRESRSRVDRHPDCPHVVVGGRVGLLWWLLASLLLQQDRLAPVVKLVDMESSRAARSRPGFFSTAMGI